MEFYNPMQRKPKSQSSGAVATPIVPGTSGVDQRFNNKGSSFGDELDLSQIASSQWGRGENFQGAGRVASIRALKNAMSTANPEDYAGMGELRDYYRNQLADLPGNTADQISSFDAQSQRGLSNLLTQHRNASAGTGRIGSRQYAGQQGNIYSKAASDYNTGLINARTNAIDQAGKIGAGLSGIQDQDLNERKFQFATGQSLSDLILKQMVIDQGRESGLAQIESENDRANKAMWAQIISSALGSAGKMASSGGGGSGGGGSGG